MTIQEIRESDKVFLTSNDVAKLLGVDPYSINLQAHEDPSKLGFQVIVIGTRIKIPRIPFLKFIGAIYGEKPELDYPRNFPAIDPAAIKNYQHIREAGYEYR